MQITGIPLIDNLFKLAMDALGIMLVYKMRKRVIELLFRHEYAKLAPLLAFGVLAFWFIWSPDSVINIFHSLIGGVTSQTRSSGVAGAGF